MNLYLNLKLYLSKNLSNLGIIRYVLYNIILKEVLILIYINFYLFFEFGFIFIKKIKIFPNFLLIISYSLSI